VLLDDPRQAAFATGFLRMLGGMQAQGPASLTLRSATDHRPRLALAPAETAWLAREGEGLVLTLPARFDGMLAACLALALPAMAALTGAAPRPETRPLVRKLASNVGLSELVLLAADGDAWLPHPAGTVTLTGLAAARAFAILPPESEGLPAGAPLAALPLEWPFG
jgi:molybdopterin biosynthesis enzyme